MKSLDIMLSKHAIYQVAKRNLARAYEDIAFPEELWEPDVQKIMIHFSGGARLLCGRDLEAQPRSVGEKDVQEWRGMMTECGRNFGVV
jgi:hypothetical protein